MFFPFLLIDLVVLRLLFEGVFCCNGILLTDAKIMSSNVTLCPLLTTIVAFFLVDFFFILLRYKIISKNCLFIWGERCDFPYLWRVKHKKAIETLENRRNELISLRNEAMRRAAAPINVEIEDIDFSIAQLRALEAKDVFNDADQDRPQEIKERKRGNQRKRIDHNAIEFKVYPFEDSVISKFRYVLKEANRFLSMPQVAQRVKEYEPKEKIEDIIIRFGKHAAKYERQGFIKSMGAGKAKKYGLPAWYKDGILERGHEPTNSLPELGEMFKKARENSIATFTPGLTVGTTALRLIDAITDLKKGL